MDWKTVAATASQETLDDLEQLLWDSGAVSVTVEDGGDAPLFEPGPGETPVWQEVVVTGLFEEDADIEGVRRFLSDSGFSVLYVNEVQDKVWEREWLERFQPMQFGQRLWVCPTGLEVPERDAIVMHLDPGLAFGTGTHATTRLCLEWLDANLPAGAEVIDYGCGSGILGIGALLLGARTVIGVDNDPQAVTATEINAQRNGVEADFPVMLPEAFESDPVDVLIANILAQPLIDLSDRLTSLIKPGGSIVLSGIMSSQIDWVAEAYQHMLLDPPVEMDGWVRLTGRKP